MPLTLSVCFLNYARKEMLVLYGMVVVRINKGHIYKEHKTRPASRNYHDVSVKCNGRQKGNSERRWSLPHTSALSSWLFLPLCSRLLFRWVGVLCAPSSPP
jgi:hypothetical protein